MFRLSYVTKAKIHVLLHPFKYGFWCILGWTDCESYGKYSKFGMLWETYDSYGGDSDYGYSYFYTGNRKTTKDLWKNYRHCIWKINDDGGFDFVLPFFLAWLIVLPGTIKNYFEEVKAKKMTKGERMKEIAKASPDFGKRVGYKMCVVDEFHDMKELLEENAELKEVHESDKRSLALIAKKGADFEKAYNETEELLDKQIEATYKVVEENKEAKEIIKELLFTSNELDENTRSKAEQFLKEE